ncbi:MAG: glycosyltransferase family 4 protein [Planctomycetota bacterium]
MKIAIFASAFHPHVGGVEELCRQLALHYKEMGHDAIVVTIRWPRDLPTHDTHDGIDVYRFAMRAGEGSLKQRLNALRTGWRDRRDIRSLMRDRRIDVINVQCVSHQGIYALDAAKALGLPVVVTTQGERTIDTGRLYQRSTLMNRVLRELVDRAAHVTGCSQDTIDELEAWYGRPLGDRKSAVYNGIRLADFDGPEPDDHPRPYVLGIGRLADNKGFDVLIDAWSRIDPSAGELDLLIAGKGDEQAKLERLAATTQGPGEARLLGSVGRERAIALFKGSAFFVLPSLDEPMGIVNLEAMAAGKAVIATRVGGVPEIVEEDRTALLVEPGNAEALAEAMTRVWTQPDLRDTLAKHGRARVERFDWSAIAAEYVALFEAAIAEKHGRHASTTATPTIATPATPIASGAQPG